MKKAFIFLVSISIVALTCTGCSRISTEQSIDKIVSDFFQGDYEYTKTYLYGENEQEQNNLVMEGKVTHSPYREYVKITSDTAGSLWSEAYYYGNGKIINAKTKTAEGWLDTKMNVEYPYGYDENLSFKLDRTEEINGIVNEVYRTEYKKDIGTEYLLDETLEATIKQEYYFDKAQKTLTRIDTDLTDLNQKVYIANEMSANGTSLTMAEKDMEQQTNLMEEQQLEIFNFGGDITIEIPGK